MNLIPKNHPEHSWSEFVAIAKASSHSVKDFEVAFAKFMNAPYAISFPHCRVAIRAALETLAPKAPDVALTSYSCIVVPHAVVLAGKTPRFFDIDLDSFNTSFERMHHSIDDKLGTILTTHMYGTAVTIPKSINDIRRPLLLIEDSALALHRPFQPKSPYLKSVTVYSFDFNKILSTIYGSMLVTHDPESAKALNEWKLNNLRPVPIAEQIKFIPKLLACKTLFDPTAYSAFNHFRELPILNQHFESRNFKGPSFPITATYELMPFQGMLGLSQLAIAHELIDRRHYWARKYHDSLSDTAGIQLMPWQAQSHYSHFPVLILNGHRDALRADLRRSGIELGQTLDYAVTDIDYYRPFKFSGFSQSEKAGREMVNLPNYPSMTESRFESIVASLKSWLWKNSSPNARSA